MSDSTPTENLATPTAPLPAAAAAPVEPASSKRTLYILLGVVAALLLAIIILLIVLLGRGGDEPTPVASESPTATESATPSATPTETSASPTPEAEPTETQAPPPPPAPPAGPIKSFTASKTTVDCSSASSVTVRFSWNTTGDTLWFGVGTTDAKLQPFSTFPLVHELDFDYQCGQSNGQQLYTISVQNGSDVTHKTITIKE